MEIKGECQQIVDELLINIGEVKLDIILDK